MSRKNWLDPVFGKSFHRADKPRTAGLTMVLDKGLGRNQFDEFLATCGEYIDHVKFPYGTSAFYDQDLLTWKISACDDRDIIVYPGGTLFEVAHQASSHNEYFKALKDVGFRAVEISSGSIDLPPEIRGELVTRASQQDLMVIAEVGTKDPDRQPDPVDMARQVGRDFSNGARYVTIESRESGKGIGIYDRKGQVIEQRLNRLIEPIENLKRIIWEAPLTNQQGYLIRRFGCNVNLGNIPTDNVLALESLRWGLRWETVEEHSPLTSRVPIEQ